MIDYVANISRYSPHSADFSKSPQPCNFSECDNHGEMYMGIDSRLMDLSLCCIICSQIKKIRVLVAKPYIQIACHLTVWTVCKQLHHYIINNIVDILASFVSNFSRFKKFRFEIYSSIFQYHVEDTP